MGRKRKVCPRVEGQIHHASNCTPLVLGDYLIIEKKGSLQEQLSAFFE